MKAVFPPALHKALQRLVHDTRICRFLCKKTFGFLRNYEFSLFRRKGLKAITPVIALVMLMLITVGMVGTAYVWFNSVQNAQTSQVFRVTYVSQGELQVTNLGTDRIQALTAFVDGQSVSVNIPSAIDPGKSGNVYLENLPQTSGEHSVRIVSPSMGSELKTKYNTIKVLSIYRCQCLIDDIAANFANKYGYPPVIVDCIHQSTLTASYDLSPYGIVVFDGADCGPNTNFDQAIQQKISDFAAGGKGIMFTHDFFLSNNNPSLLPVAGVNSGSCSDSVATQKLSSEKISEKPYSISSGVVIQPTHPDNEVLTTAREIFGSSGVCDNYLISNVYGSGKAVFTQWGHYTFDCNCDSPHGLPGENEQKALTNAVYWAAGV